MQKVEVDKMLAVMVVNGGMLLTFKPAEEHFKPTQ